MDDRFRAVLRELCRSRVVIPEEMAARLGLDLRTVLSVIGALESGGFIKRNECSSCKVCPLRNICPFSVKPPSSTVSYYLTDRGKTACKNL